MKLNKFTEAIVINVSRESVFDYTQDYNQRLKWDTFLKRADLMDGATAVGKGVKAYCVSRNGLGMITEYITYNRPKVTAIKMTEGPYIFSSFYGSWTFNVISDNKTEVVFLYACSLRFPFSLWTGFVKKNLRNNVRKRLLDLKKSIEL